MENQPNKGLQLQELHEAEMYAFVAPDGSIQLNTVTDDFALTMAICHIMSIAKLGQSPQELFEQGYEVLPVKVTVVQNGTAQEGYTKSRNKALSDSGKL